MSRISRKELARMIMEGAPVRKVLREYIDAIETWANPKDLYD